MMRALIDEVISAARGLSRAPAFTALAVSVLGLGMGAVVGMFGIADTMLWKPPPFPHAERLYAVELNDPARNHFKDSMAPHDYVALRDAQGLFEAFGAVYTGTVYLTGDGQAERYDGGFATPGMFDVAGVAPMLGRVLEPSDDVEGAKPVVVLSHDLWRTRFGSDPGVVGRTIRLNRTPSEVVGVMPEGFHFPAREELWLPAKLAPEKMTRSEAASVHVFGRLRPGATPDEAQQEFAPVAARMLAEEGANGWGGQFELRPFAGAWAGHEGAEIFGVLMIAVAFVLLIACANVSNLLLSRAAYRVREASLRSALGATRARLVAHILAEGLVISALAALLGLLLAAMSLDAMRLVTDRMIGNAPAWWRFEIDARVAAVTIALGLASSVLSGLPAAFRASRPSLDAMLRDGGRTGTGLAVGRITWTLVVVEVALACVLLGGAALMARSVAKVAWADVGVETGDIMTARAGLPIGTNGYEEIEGRARFWTTLLDNLERQPGIDSAAITVALPRHGSWTGMFEIDGREQAGDRKGPEIMYVEVSPSFFATLRTGALQGRLLDDGDRMDTLPVAVVNEAFVRAAWPGGSPLGDRLRFVSEPDSPWYTVVGVVPDIVHDDAGDAEPVIYVPVAQRAPRFMSIMVRGPGDPRALAPAIRAALAETDPDLALYWVRTLDEAMLLTTAGFRIIGTMFAIFAGIALLLAAAGLFGVLAFHVGQRTRELGVRRALGADDGRILGLVLRASGSQVLIGVGLGLALLPFVGRGLGIFLLDMTPYDPRIYAAVAGGMLVVAAAATLAPTRRALRIDPAAALRYE